MTQPLEGPTSRTPADLPKAMRLAWGLEEVGSRGPRKGLTLDRVLDAAIEVADVEGLAGLSMSRVAKQLGFTTMSLYWYVDSKGRPDRADGRPRDRRPARRAAGIRSVSGPARGLGRAEYRSARVHAWWAELSISAPPTGPNNLSWLEAGLRTLADTTLPEDTKVQVVLNVSLFVIGRARFVNDLERSAVSTTPVDYSQMLPLLLDRERFPALLSAIAAGAFDPGGSDDADWLEDDFCFGLDRMLDGIDRLVEQTNAG
ncbi:TetR/AcrR family transcriptional regulator [Rhodococcus sp. USK13]|uniref:TetR/AcrR family transcriptional regulator n=1 Tax=Rhodococcus sp. USK13 TaxID=2806442 RepID=UPI0032D5AF9A